MFNIRKNYRYNTLIVPNVNYFFEQSKKVNDPKLFIMVTMTAITFFNNFVIKKV